jgi:GntR family transcriptional regulator
VLQEVNPNSSVPLHAQIAEAIQVAVARGELRPGNRLPTVRQLAVELKVNSNTVARVYQDLERAGLLETRRGAGTFVRASARVDQSAVPRRILSLCREFVGACAREGFTLTDILHALREIDNASSTSSMSSTSSSASTKDGG